MAFLLCVGCHSVRPADLLIAHCSRSNWLLYINVNMFQTYIFFDTETTGLITKCMPKIAELSLIAVSRNAISVETGTLPRVLSKLVLPINPVREIPKEIETLTGLSNESVNDVGSFTRDTYDLIVSFINRLTPPVCFVAYNGDGFDYPILLWELGNINVNVDKAICSIDMMLLIKDYFSSIKSGATCISEDVDILLNDGCNEMLSDALDTVMRDNEEGDACSNSPRIDYYYEEEWEINKRRPERSIIKQPNIKSTNRGSNRGRETLHLKNSKPSNFKLRTIYKHFFGTDSPNAHTAEGDCLSMIQCAIQIKHFFLEWADLNAVPMIKHKKRGF
ncbi:three-prime repair exonuclease 1 isoform X1 [Megalopta genalis]|uniref:three-prime repair exonuclease 1 isoform X1 n=2 Tax=Megalopta genalis TaxID=115081 RepID=UPI003FD55B3A